MFTRQERKVILFLMSTALIGLGADFIIKINPQAKKFIRTDEIIAKININKAGFEDLVQIKGISPKLARSIIAYRDKYGFFRELEGLKEIKGIGEVRYGKIKDCFTLE